MAKLNRKAVLLAKIQAALGTPAAPVGVDAILVRNLTIKPVESEYVARDVIRPWLGNSEQLAVAVHTEMDFEVEMAGSGAAGTVPGWGGLLRACGFAETISAGVDVKYAPVSTFTDYITIFGYLDGVLHKLTDGLGTVVLDVTSKTIPVLRFHFMGAWSPVTDAAAPTPDFTKFKMPLPVNKSNTPSWSLHGVTGPLQSLQVDLGNQLVFRSLIGSEKTEITDRKTAGNIVMELNTVATKDWWQTVKDAVTAALTLTHGVGAGKVVQIDAPKAQISNLAYSDDNGVAMVSGNLALNPNAGNDELVITVK